MRVLTLLLMCLTVSGQSYVLQPRLTVTQITGLDRDHQSEIRAGQLRNVFISVEEEEKAAVSAERQKTEIQGSDGWTPETNPEKMMKQEKNTKSLVETIEGHDKRSEETPETHLGEETKGGEFFGADMVKDLDTDKEDEVEGRKDLETKSQNTKTWATMKTVKIQDKRKDAKTLEKLGKSEQMDKPRREIEEEEREGMLVAGIDLHEFGEKMLNPGNEQREKREEEGENIKDANYNDLEGEKEGHMLVSNLTPPLSSSWTQLGGDFNIPATNPASSPPPFHQHNAPPSVPPVSLHPPTPHARVFPQFFPPLPTTIISVSTVAPDEVRFRDLLTEVLQSPGHHLKQNKLEVKAGPNLEEDVKNILFKPAHKQLEATRVQPIEAQFNTGVEAAVPKSTDTDKDLKTEEPNPAPKSKENNPTAKTVEFTHKQNMTQTTDKPKLTVKRNKESPLQPKLNNPSAKTQPTTAKTPSMTPKKINKSSKNRTTKKSKENKRKKDNKTQKPPEKKKIKPTYFPYFKDNYCPPDCACYGRVVQCSDKGVDKIPYGIPYNARYILLMNNRIDSIQLDLLNEYISMEFLVLSNNQLTDGAIEGAFEGILALKRLYLDRNLLLSVPTDLPLSLEELRLDNNQLSVMSEDAWARCPGLLVLSLSNNSLGNGSESLPNAVLSPLSNLRTLNLDHNQLTSVPLGLPLSVKELYLKGNLIQQFRGGAFNGISELVVLDLSTNKLTNKGLLRDSLLNATHLESLNLEGNRLKQVPRHLPRSLKTLNLEGNLISSIKKAALGTLKNLEHLGLARNKIFKVAPGAFKALPVLHQLDLCHNTLHQVPRQLPQALHLVTLTHNKIQSVPRDAFCWGDKSLSRLVRVQLENNLIDMGKLDAQAFRCLRGFQVVHFY